MESGAPSVTITSVMLMLELPVASLVTGNIIVCVHFNKLILCTLLVESGPAAGFKTMARD